MEGMIASVERQISSPMLIAGRIMTTADDEPSTSYATPRKTNRPAILQTPKLDRKYFDEERCYAPSKRDSRIRNRHPIELCSTLQPIADSPLSPPPHERGPYHHTPEVQAVPNVMQTVGSHIQNSKQFDKIDTTQFTGCLICGKSIQAIKEQSLQDFLKVTTVPGEPEETTKIRAQSFIAGMGAGTFLFVPPAVSQAAACDGVQYSLGTQGGRAAPGTLPIN